MTSRTAMGAILVLTGLTTIVGSITGNLGGMLAALFDPSALPGAQSAKTGGGTSSGIGGIIHNLGGSANLPGFTIA